MLIKMIFVIILFLACIKTANLKLSSILPVDHEDEHNENNEPDEAGSNDVKCQSWKGKNTTGQY